MPINDNCLLSSDRSATPSIKAWNITLDIYLTVTSLKGLFLRLGLQDRHRARVHRSYARSKCSCLSGLPLTETVRDTPLAACILLYPLNLLCFLAAKSIFAY